MGEILVQIITASTVAELFDSNIDYYLKYRRDCPESIIQMISNEFNLTSDSTILDLGTGTGQIAIPISKLVNKVHAIDINSGMIERAITRAGELKIDNISFRVLDANKDRIMGKYDVAVFGSSFHWFDRASILKKLKFVINKGICILGAQSIWNGKSEWEKKITELIQKYLGKDRKAGNTTYDIDTPHEEVLSESEFSDFSSNDIIIQNKYTIDELIGLIYSTSYGKPEFFGENITQFDEEARSILSKNSDNGVLIQDQPYYIIFAKRE